MNKDKIISTVKMTCPRCQEGHLFTSKNPYAIGKMTVMHETCSVCGLKYDKEPGFFYGAMYISYVINIAFFVVAVVLYFNALKWMGLYPFILAFIGFMVLLFPITYRISRSVWIHIFIEFDLAKGGRS